MAAIRRVVIGDITLSLERKVETDEYVVYWIQNKKKNEDKSYFTDDKQDAIDTLKDMANRLLKTIQASVFISKKTARMISSDPNQDLIDKWKAIMDKFNKDDRAEAKELYAYMTSNPLPMKWVDDNYPNLIKKKKKNVYQHSLAIKLFLHVVDQSAKQYAKTFAEESYRFKRQDRLDVADALAYDFEYKYENKEIG